MDTKIILPVALGLAAYLIGGVPFGYVLVKLLAGKDIRTAGSGNTGATNAARVLGKPMGILVLLLDAFKGYTAATLLPMLAPGAALSPLTLGAICGFLAVVGHNWPVYLRFRGGKGVATSLGVAVALDPVATGVAAMAYAVVRYPTRIVSAGSLAAAVVFPLVVLTTRQPYTEQNAGLIVLSVALPLLIVARHHENIRRLIAGRERKVGEGRTERGKE